jgi:formylglycine-generating enzyme required for sulfatase activity/uncharacterized caspase-like protein
VTSKFALVIANTEYQDASFAKLTAPGKDAEEFADVLSNSELAAFDDVQILLNEGESKIRRSIARFFVNRQRDDLLLLYFSGHGVRNDQGQLFLAANDTEISILEATGIPADFVTHAMNNSRSQRQLLILDCCNSGAFAHGSKSAAAIGKSMGIATAFEGSGFGRVVLTATDSTQYAWEGDKVIGNTQKSVFTHFLIEGLKGEADRDGDGRIHVDELYDYAYEQVVRRTPKQTPGKWSYKQQGDLILRENLKTRNVKPVPLPADIFYYLDHPSSGVRSTGVEELIRLLDGKHLGLARAAQEKLREIAENDDSLSLRRIASETLIAHGFEPEKPEPVEDLSEVLREEKIIENLPVLHPRKLSEKKEVAPNLNFRLVGGIAGGLVIISLLIWGGSKLLQNLPAITTEPTHTFLANVTFTSTTSRPNKTDTPSPSRTSIPLTQTNIPPTSQLGIGSTMISDKDGMTLLYVPAGDFVMGSDNGAFDERPAHPVNLNAFWIDKTEVTNVMYAKCVQEGFCNPPRRTGSATRSSYYGNPEFDNYPVVYLTWGDANSYCSWAGRRLSMEAEWEKAARGENALEYPWGNNSPSKDLLNYENLMRDTTEVGKYPTGASPYGALDMAGNVWEWVADWHDNTYYRNSPRANPLGPNSGNLRVFRGGSWYRIWGESGSNAVRTWNRNKSDPAEANYYFGFRCAMSATP